MGPNIEKTLDKSTLSLVKRLAGIYLRPYTGRLVVALILMVIAAVSTVTFAKLIQPVFDDVLVDTQEHLILPLSVAVFACFFVSGIATYGHTLIMNAVGQSIVSSIQRDLFSRFIDLDLRFFHDNPSGQLVSRVINDVNMLRSSVTDGLTGIGKSLLTLVFLVALMFYQDWRLALIAFCAFPMAAFFVGWIGRRLRKVSGSIQTEIASLTDTLSQIFQGMRQVKAYGAEDYERDRAGAAIDRVRDLVVKAVKVGTLSTPFNETLLGLAVMGVILYGGHRVLDGALTVGELTSFIAAFSLAYEPMKRLAKLNNTLQMGLGAAERVFEMMGREPQVKDKPEAAELRCKAPDIVFEDVSFSYDEEDGVYALDHISLRLPAGKVTALVGPSGSGKTTVMNLIPRFYDVTGGRVLIDGQDVRDVTLASLRSQIALVSQDITIFDDTVAANIAYGQAEASEADIIQAAKDAAADEFIRSLPQGYETRLGEHGSKLSGGQRQRIAIARAMLKNAPILLLDEATSALDSEAEKAIQESLSRLQKGRTTLVIAHRLSTIEKADQIIALDRGHIVESGNHDDLMDKQGLYARMQGL